ncbi:glycerate kinase [Prevotella sp. 10(H)]|uniref:glycerate kinase n=1 Tax=Prevotella sp. 10(H) TaxID=1158294 RepID=UPI0004A784AB|nr:glycerate kinase [Prevotella sp. 10(H)]
MHNPVFVLALDSFKGSMTAKEVCEAMEKGIKKVLPDAVCIKIPMADGGEGTMQALVDVLGGEIFEQEVTGPLGNQVTASYAILDDKQTAVIEMASASGLQHLSKAELNPLVTTTFGTGEIVRTCLDKGVKKIILGLGGSATNDGGSGFMQALGAKFLDKEGFELPFGGGALKYLHKIDISSIDKRLGETTIEVACDVTNPLCGENGASVVYGPQKVATPEMVRILDDALNHYSQVIKNQLEKDVADIPCAGAAGGLGAGLLAFTNANLCKGIDIVIKHTNLREAIKKADFVFTGEGRIDSQTQYGKTPFGVAQVAKSENKRVIAIAGSVGDGVESLYEAGFDAIFSIIPDAISLEIAMQSGKENIERTMENIIRVLVMK